MKWISKLFGTKHDRLVKKIQPRVDEINEVFETLSGLSDDELKAKTDEFKQRIQEHMDGFDKYSTVSDEDPEREKKARKNEVNYLNEILDEILPEAFAVVKETCRRLKEREYTFDLMGSETVWDMVPYDVQLIGGMMLHEGKIAEMATGEGKTLVATMPMYLNALTGRGAHLVTVNDYLAQRDAVWMGQVYEFLGLSVGTILGQMTPEERKVSYGADITYGTNNEFGFDYLRDNMAVDAASIVQRGHHYAIVDEVDSVLIDEARTPLIIAGPVPRSSEGDFNVWNPDIARLVRRQQDFVRSLIADAERILNQVEEGGAEDATEFDAGIMLYQARRGAPKNKRLMKIINAPGRKRLIDEVENTFIRDKKLHELDDDLYFVVDEKGHTIDLTDKGRDELAKISNKEVDFFMLPDLGDLFADVENDDSMSDEEKAEKKGEAEQELAVKSSTIHTINQLLRAHSLYERDDEYVIEGGKVQIVDEFTGRIMHGRRYSDGLHQAIEAKEGVRVEAETQTIASITLQNYFRLYGKLAGMTGTAETEEDEFFKIYELEVSVIPTNVPIKRIDAEDLIYKTQREKYNAIVEEIVRLHELGLPVLVGTTSVEVSELIARILGNKTVSGRKLKDKIQVLNAKQHQREAEIVTNAGRPGAITIATNMAGRGTDIKISREVANAHNENGVITQRIKADPSLVERHQEEHGIDPNVQPGGLQIVGTERHEARRIDRQLRGRSGRQGDPGYSQFFLSLEDDLMRLFGGERIGRIMDKLGLEEGEIITHSMVTNAIEKAQKRVEQHNFSIREHLLKYDDVMNVQREVVYARRKSALTGDIDEEVANLLDEYIAITVDQYADEREPPHAWDLESLRNTLLRTLMIDVHFTDKEIELLSLDELEDAIRTKAKAALEKRKRTFGEELYEKLLRFSVLKIVDREWMDHLYEMDRLKEGIGLRSYAQRDPLVEYKRDGLAAFEQMLGRVAEKSLRAIFSAQIQMTPAQSVLSQPIAAREIKDDAQQTSRAQAAQPVAAEAEARGGPQAAGAQRGKAQPVKRDMPKVGRNDPCPCGSGQKYKHCHGR